MSKSGTGSGHWAVVLTFLAFGCSSSTHKDQNYGTDVGVGYQLPDGGLLRDSGSSTVDTRGSVEAATGDGAKEGAGNGADATDVVAVGDSGADAAMLDTSAADAAKATAADASPACLACETRHIQSGDCESMAGCDSLAGTKKDLCVSLLTCMRNHPACWANDPQVCLCGTSGGACATSPNGPCVAEAMAAAETTDLVETGKRFFKLDYPSGHATQLVACDTQFCLAECTP